MSANLATLRKSADDSAHWRGHVIIWEPAEERARGRWIQLGQCKNCDRGVIVRTHPAPNEIEIGGEAVATGCVY